MNGNLCDDLTGGLADMKAYCVTGSMILSPSPDAISMQRSRPRRFQHDDRNHAGR